MTRDLYRSGSEDVDNEDDEEKHTEEVSRTIIHQEAMTMMNTWNEAKIFKIVVYVAIYLTPLLKE